MTHQKTIPSDRTFLNQHKAFFFRASILALAAGAALFLLMLSGCDGGGGSGASGEGPGLNEGIFVDSPVAGLNYQTETQNGVTDAEGAFHYTDGEHVRFSIGDVVLGEAPAESLMTPLHLVNEPIESVDVTHPVVTNMARFIQSLDEDADPDNGIRITDTVRGEVTGRMIDFHQSVEEFENDPQVTMMFDTLNGMGVPHNGELWHLRAAGQARQHMSDHMDDWMGPHMGGAPDSNAGNDDVPDESGGNGPQEGGMPGSDDGTDIGGGSGNDNGGRHQGIFVDSPVAGLNYQSATQSGVTDAEGTFHYMTGETIRFSIGDVVLGEAPAEAVMTPLHLAGEPIDDVNADNPVVVNMIRFMQSLDADHDPENGITLTDAVRSEVSGRMIDFHQSVHDFENDARVMAMFDAMNGLNMPHSGHAWRLHDTDEALSHMIGYMDRHMGDWADVHMGAWMDEWMDGHMNDTNGQMPGRGGGPMMGR